MFPIGKLPMGNMRGNVAAPPCLHGSYIVDMVVSVGCAWIMPAMGSTIIEVWWPPCSITVKFVF
jgi:hypothetical protein